MVRILSSSTVGLVAMVSAVAFASAADNAPQSDWVHAAADGRLVYKADARGNRIPDFSNVGYRGGAVALPDVPVRATVGPDVGDAGERIQAAIDAVSKLPADAAGHRGAVLLKKGRYPIAGVVALHTSGVVLRGEGQDADGTVLIATGAKQRSLILVGAKGRGVASPGDDGEAETPRAASAAGVRYHVTSEYVPVGSREFDLDRVDGLAVGTEIVIRRPSTAEWIHDIGMDRIPPKANTVQWKPGSKDLVFNRRVVGLEGHHVTVDAPLVNALEQKYGGAEVAVAKDDFVVREVGVENLRGDSEYAGDTDEKHGWILVDLVSARDCWVHDVTAVHFGYSCVNARRATLAITVDRCTCLDPISQITGGRRYSFAVDGQLTLVQHCRARGGRHDFVMHSLAAGPNVFFDCLAEEAHADSGPHHRWSVGVLYDNVRIAAPRGAPTKGIGINIRNRGNSGSGHGWAGANQVIWNSVAPEMIVQQPPTAQNWAIGCTAANHSGDGYWESFGHPVQPKSLYLAQLRERVGRGSKGMTQ